MQNNNFIRKAYVYKITNPKGSVYVGSTFNIKTRWATYKSLKFKNQQKLKNSLLKYGIKNHSFEVLCECTNENRNITECCFGYIYRSLDRVAGLNLQLPKSILPYSGMSNEMKEKISEQAKKRVGRLNPAWGIRRPDFAKMAKIRGLTLIGDKNPMFGTIRPDYVKKAISKSRTERESKGVSPRNKYILDLASGVFYKSAMEVILLYKFKKSSFVSKLNGSRKNNTNFIYA